MVELVGFISNSGESPFLSESSVSADGVVEDLESACKNSGIGAVLLKVDSPGGEITASERIKFAVDACEKPVVSYIESVGASGAYLASLPADKILAYPSSITADIGVVSEYLEFARLMGEHGVVQRKLSRGEFKGVPDPFSEIPEEKLREVFDPILDQLYASFRDDVVVYRGERLAGSSMEFIESEIANGRPVTGKKALELGLIDGLVTSKKEALDEAAALAGLGEDYQVVEFKKKKGLLELFSESFFAPILSRLDFKSQLMQAGNPAAFFK